MLTTILQDINKNITLPADLKEALIGIALKPDLQPIASYDYCKSIGILMTSHNLTQDEAILYLQDLIVKCDTDTAPVFTLLISDILDYDHDKTLKKILDEGKS